MTALEKKVQGVQPVDVVYPRNAIHKFNEEALGRDWNGVEELIIDGDKYKVLQDENGNYSLKRFNEKYKMWVDIRFTGAADDIQSVIVERLKKQFIDVVLSKTVDDTE